MLLPDNLSRASDVSARWTDSADFGTGNHFRKRDRAPGPFLEQLACIPQSRITLYC